tara:strand:+ start:302 stop:565 length:264 start_codon:yes stop_codon:yes gene_type:complete
MRFSSNAQQRRFNMTQEQKFNSIVESNVREVIQNTWMFCGNIKQHVREMLRDDFGIKWTRSVLDQVDDLIVEELTELNSLPWKNNLI